MSVSIRIMTRGGTVLQLAKRKGPDLSPVRARGYWIYKSSSRDALVRVQLQRNSLSQQFSRMYGRIEVLTGEEATQLTKMETFNKKSDFW